MTITETSFTGVITGQSVDSGTRFRGGLIPLVKQFVKKVWAIGLNQSEEGQRIVSRTAHSEMYIIEFGSD